MITRIWIENGGRAYPYFTFTLYFMVPYRYTRHTINYYSRCIIGQRCVNRRWTYSFGVRTFCCRQNALFWVLSVRVHCRRRRRRRRRLVNSDGARPVVESSSSGRVMTPLDGAYVNGRLERVGGARASAAGPEFSARPMDCSTGPRAERRTTRVSRRGRELGRPAFDPWPGGPERPGDGRRRTPDRT